MGLGPAHSEKEDRKTIRSKRCIDGCSRQMDDYIDEMESHESHYIITIYIYCIYK